MSIEDCKVTTGAIISIKFMVRAIKIHFHIMVMLLKSLTDCRGEKRGKISRCH